MNKEDVVYIHIVEKYSGIKKNEILSFVKTWIAKWNKSKKDKHHDFTYMQNLINKTKLTDTENSWWLPEGSAVAGWAKWVEWIKEYKLPVIK